MAKIVTFFQKIAIGNFLEKKDNFWQFFSKTMSNFWQFFWHSHGNFQEDHLHTHHLRIQTGRRRCLHSDKIISLVIYSHLSVKYILAGNIFSQTLILSELPWKLSLRRKDSNLFHEVIWWKFNTYSNTLLYRPTPYTINVGGTDYLAV